MRTLRRILAGLLVVVLIVGGYVSYHWAEDIPLSELKARWAPEPSRFIELGGMSVHVRDQGSKDAPVLLLLHGTSASLHTWQAWASALQDEYRVISLDLPGFGLTGPFPDDDYRLARYSQFLAQFLDQLGVTQASLVGNSFGGQLAWQFTVDHPERVQALVLIDASGYPRQSTSIPLAFRLAAIPALKPVMAKLLPRSLIASSVRSVYGEPERVTDELIERYYQLALREGNRAALRKRFAQFSEGVQPALIKQIKAPTLIVWGRRDGLIPLDNAQRFKDDIADSQLVVFDTLGHVPQEEDPTATLAVVRPFLEQAQP